MPLSSMNESSSQQDGSYLPSNSDNNLFSMKSSNRAVCNCSKVLIINPKIPENKVISQSIEMRHDQVTEVILESFFW